jgi:hypothetical protein
LRRQELLGRGAPPKRRRPADGARGGGALRRVGPARGGRGRHRRRRGGGVSGDERRRRAVRGGVGIGSAWYVHTSHTGSRLGFSLRLVCLLLRMPLAPRLRKVELRHLHLSIQADNGDCRHPDRRCGVGLACRRHGRNVFVVYHCTAATWTRSSSSDLEPIRSEIARSVWGGRER